MVLDVLQNKAIVLGVTGSIAAYKALELMRRLCDAGAEVFPVLTPGACRFVAPLSFSVLSGHRAVTDLWSSAQGGEVGHVELAHTAQILVIAPATADSLAKLCDGRANDPLSAIALATHAKLVVAPAMEAGMWAHPSTQEHIALLQRRGATIVFPETGHLASGRSGMGRMAALETIIEAIAACCTPQDLQGRRLVISAGATREIFDPARFVSNRSSGKMGYALARVAKRRGAEVTLISGPTQLHPPVGVTTTYVESTEQMRSACSDALKGADALLMAAAPVDFKPQTVHPQKLKKTATGSILKLDFVSTTDILADLHPRQQGCLTVGFAAESTAHVQHATAKLQAKDLDMIVANDISGSNTGFAVDTNAVTIVHRDGKLVEVPLASKEQIATAILDEVVDLLQRRR